MAVWRSGCSGCEDVSMKLDIGGGGNIQAPGDRLLEEPQHPPGLTRCFPGCQNQTQGAPPSMAVWRSGCSGCEDVSMKLDIGGVETIQAPVDVLWKALNDPTVLTRCIPGCKTMTEIAPDAYKVEMQLRVAAVGGSFEGEIALSDKDPPKACSIPVSGAGTLC